MHTTVCLELRQEWKRIFHCHSVVSVGCVVVGVVDKHPRAVGLPGGGRAVRPCCDDTMM